MKNIVRKCLSILVLFIAWYCLATGISSLLGTFSLLASINTSITLWNIKWFNVITEPMLIVGLLLLPIGTALWNWRQWRIIIGILMLVEGLDAVARAMSVLYAPGPSSEFFHAPTFISGYIFFAALSFLLGVFLIRNHRIVKKPNKRVEEN